MVSAASDHIRLGQQDVVLHIQQAQRHLGALHGAADTHEVMARVSQHAGFGGPPEDGGPGLDPVDQGRELLAGLPDPVTLEAAPTQV